VAWSEATATRHAVVGAVVDGPLTVNTTVPTGAGAPAGGWSVAVNATVPAAGTAPPSGSTTVTDATSVPPPKPLPAGAPDEAVPEPAEAPALAGDDAVATDEEPGLTWAPVPPGDAPAGVTAVGLDAAPVGLVVTAVDPAVAVPAGAGAPAPDAAAVTGARPPAASPVVGATGGPAACSSTERAAN
jgi:hypothetical protein